jgi:hypothetical protein
MTRLLACVSLALLLLGLCWNDLAAEDLTRLTGEFERRPVENPWHEGEIVIKKTGGRRILEWRNKAGAAWDLVPDLEKGVLRTGPRNPYHKQGTRTFDLELEGGRLVAFGFGGELFVRKGVTRLAQKSGGLKGYISMSVPPPPSGYGHGVSFYASVWQLVSKPLSGFQIGLPSTWVIPNNRDFQEALVPPGTRAHGWKERAPVYHDVFQTIEGGLGYWGSTQFGSPTPKYRMNGTPNGYNHEISSPGWGFGSITALTAAETGIAQLSNQLLVPPDGLTFAPVESGQLLGNAWMSLPLIPAREGPDVPTGDQSWTLFLRASNFEGAVAFWIPDTWSRLSRSYRTIVGRGLDARPGVMGSGAMEVNTVPYFEVQGARDVTYSKIPQLSFPIDKTGRTILMQDITLYGAEALLEPMRTGLQKQGALPQTFDLERTWKPDCKAQPLRLQQGPSNTPLVGYADAVKTITFGEEAKNAFGLEWARARGTGTLPQYFRTEKGRRIAVREREVPKPLRSAVFREAAPRGPYAPPDGESFWTKGTKRRGPFQTKLTDGSTVTYAWYRFVDQPSIRAQGWSQAEREALQAIVERLHEAWKAQPLSMPAPSRGALVGLDPALFVDPPRGLEIGYVPIVIGQSAE